MWLKILIVNITIIRVISHLVYLICFCMCVFQISMLVRLVILTFSRGPSLSIVIRLYLYKLFVTPDFEIHWMSLALTWHWSLQLAFCIKSQVVSCDWQFFVVSNNFTLEMHYNTLTFMYLWKKLNMILFHLHQCSFSSLSTIMAMLHIRIKLRFNLKKNPRVKYLFHTRTFSFIHVFLFRKINVLCKVNYQTGSFSQVSDNEGHYNAPPLPHHSQWILSVRNHNAFSHQ